MRVRGQGLRPLRALKRVPGMPVLVSSILKSMPALLDVAVLAAFVFFVFACFACFAFVFLKRPIICVRHSSVPLCAITCYPQPVVDKPSAIML